MGEVFAGRYELVDPVGRGGVGAVWRAWDHRRRRYVAAKVLQQSDAHALLRFVREQAMRIDHPHVLAPASWAADDDKVLFTMDLVCGGSLSHLVGDYGPLPPRLVCVLLDQLLAGLAAVHAEGIVHRDIKPANVLLEATGTGTPHVRLSDFGIAMRMGDARLTEIDYVVGTPGYFAPEQLLGAEPDFAADLYAVGLVALYLLSGQKPDAQALVDRFEATAGTPPAPVGVPDPLWQVVGALLQPDPYQRFRTATGARKALAAAVPLLPEGGGHTGGDEPVEIFDLIGPLPEGFGPDGPLAGAVVPQGAGRAEDAGRAEGAGVSEGAGGPDPAAGPEGATNPEDLGNPVGPAAPGLPVPPQPPTPPDPVPHQPTPPDPAPQQPGPPDPGPPRRRGRHAAPLPAHEQLRSYEPLPPYGPMAHTETRTGAPAPPPAAGPAELLAPTRLPGVHAPLPGTGPSTDTSTAPDPAPAPAPRTDLRPGPPARLAVTVLVLAAICFAVGIAALVAS